jgi:hypothetical protein
MELIFNMYFLTGLLIGIFVPLFLYLGIKRYL